MNRLEGLGRMIPPDIRAHIEALLAATAVDEGVRILNAAESGSRAWGFGSPDSDYDVRFLYAHPRDWYLRLSEGRDVIERPLDAKLVDLAGWDIRKTLRLLLKSNPALYEWLVSPIVYVDSPLRAALKTMFEAHASPKALAYHYWSIARGQWQREIDGRDEVRLKKYFYVVRPLLSLSWIVEHATPPPMSIDALLGKVPMAETPRAALDALPAQTRAMPELGRRPRLAAIDDWALAELERLCPDRLALSDKPRQDMREDADRLFRRIIDIES
jgi:predicted nucleotidyltransferase